MMRKEGGKHRGVEEIWGSRFLPLYLNKRKGIKMEVEEEIRERLGKGGGS